MTSKWVQEECSHFHWLLTHLIRKKTVFANHTKTGVVTAQLMSTTKIEEKLRLMPYIVFAHPGGLSPNWPQRHAFSLRGSIMIFCIYA